VRSIDFNQLASGFVGSTDSSSNYNRLQKFFDEVEFDQRAIAALIVHLLSMDTGDTGTWTLAIDRGIWKFNRINFNTLVLNIAFHGVYIPIFWTIIDRSGHSNTAERIAIMERFIASFGVDKISILLADREFVGADWFSWLQEQKIPFYQRIKSNTLIPDRFGRTTRLDTMFCLLRPDESCLLEGQRQVWNCPIQISTLRLKNSDLLVIAGSDAPQNVAIETYMDNIVTKNLFDHLKICGFNFEGSDFKDAIRLSKMLGVLALAFAWDDRTGKTLQDKSKKG
jgi:hypothetical protein